MDCESLMAGIYIHIPFCRRGCHYCDFTFTTRLGGVDDMVGYLQRELSLRRDYLGKADVRTVYFGGGTPSLLTEGQVKGLLGQVRDHYRVNDLVEVTLETNPEDITPLRLKAWMAMGINRLSVGVQSFFEEDLVYLSRRHEQGQAEKVLGMLGDVGIKNYSLDLIYGMPTLTLERWAANLSYMARYEVPHFSAYELTVEEGTALKRLIERNRKPAPKDEVAAEQFEWVMSFGKEKGYEHYEISNFARPGKRSLHHMNYWNNGLYLGVGPGAHSYNGWARQWNTSDIGHYMACLKAETIPFVRERLGLRQKYDEYILTRLRGSDGIHLGDLYKRFGSLYGDYFRWKMQDPVLRGKVLMHLDGAGEEVYRLSDAGKLVADGVIREMFYEDGR